MRVLVLGVALLALGICSGAVVAEPVQPGSAAVAVVVEGAAAPGAGVSPSADAGEASGAATPPVDEAPPPPVVAKPSPPPPPSLVVDIDLTAQRMSVSERGQLKHTWPISSGRAGYNTPTGTFRPTWMAKMWYSRQYDDAPMPHSVFFNGGIAVHGTQHVRSLGRPASHGCIRLAPANAARLYALVSSHGKAMTRIKVFGTARDSAPVAARQPRIEAGERYAVRRWSNGHPAARYYPPPRYSYNGYGAGYSPRYVYPGDPLPYGYRSARPLYRPYGGSRGYSYYD